MDLAISILLYVIWIMDVSVTKMWNLLVLCIRWAYGSSETGNIYMYGFVLGCFLALNLPQYVFTAGL